MYNIYSLKSLSKSVIISLKKMMIPIPLLVLHLVQALGTVKVKYEDSEHVKEDRVNTVIFNLHQIKHWAFFWDTWYIGFMSSKVDFLKKIAEHHVKLEVEMAKNAKVSDNMLPIDMGKKKP